MDSFLLLLCSLLIGVVASNGALLPAQVYWHTVLPNTPIPTAFSDLLYSGNDGVKVGATMTVKPKYEDAKVVEFRYAYGVAEEEVLNNLHNNAFFLEQDLHTGSKMSMQFDSKNVGAKFLPRSEAESIPFSLKQLPEIISRFSVQRGSDEEKAIKETLGKCADPGLMEAKRTCATSLESIVDYTVANLGTRNVIAVSTTVHSKDETSRQDYTIVSSGVKSLAQDVLVACHQQSYLYVVFYCHLAKLTKSYTVKMVGKDGTVVEAVAVCHTDTSAWNPKHLAFQVLNVKPGTVPVCHFLPRSHVVFGRTN